MQRRIKSEPETPLVQTQEILRQQQVSRTRNGQKLREPLDHAEKNRFEDFQDFMVLRLQTSQPEG